MRLYAEIKEYIIRASDLYFPDATIYLFGSRTDDNRKGGDIDLLLLSRDKIPHGKLRQFRIGFYKKFGWQKIDLVNFTFADNSTFKQIALEQSILLK